MITIRLQRRGRKNDPSFRVIVVDSHRAAKTGDFIEVVGNYHPGSDQVELKTERIKHWIGNGAQVSDTVHNILVSQKVIEGKKRNVLPKKTVEKPAEEVAPASDAPAAPEASDVVKEAAASPASAEEPAPASAEAEAGQ